MWFTKLCTLLVAVALLTAAQSEVEVRPPPEIGAAYGRLGKAIGTRDVAGMKAVWADDFVVNSPGGVVLRRDAVIDAVAAELLEYRDFRKHITVVDTKPELVVVMGYDTLVPVNGPGAGKRVTRPFTDVWVQREGRWWLVARQATISALE